MSGEQIEAFEKDLAAWIEKYDLEEWEVRAILSGWVKPASKEEPVIDSRQMHDLYWHLHTLSKILESSGRIDEMEHKDAYRTILDAMQLARASASSAQAEPAPVAFPKQRDLFLSDDMEQGQLRVMFDGDNDVIVAIWPNGAPSASVEFCNSFNGGGKSPETRKALIALMCAMERDGATNSPRDQVPGFQAFHVGDNFIKQQVGQESQLLQPDGTLKYTEADGTETVSPYPSDLNATKAPPKISEFPDLQAAIQKGLADGTITITGGSRVAEKPLAKFEIGGRYNWQGQQERLVYLGHNFSGNGRWHQFAKVEDPEKVWCEVQTEDLYHFEATAPVHEDVKINEELHQERERRQQLEAELLRMQGRELKLQMALAKAPSSKISRKDIKVIPLWADPFQKVIRKDELGLWVLIQDDTVVRYLARHEQQLVESALLAACSLHNDEGCENSAAQETHGCHGGDGATLPKAGSIAEQLDRLLWAFIDLQSKYPSHAPKHTTWPHVLVYAPKKELPEHDEDWLERAYWEFDAARSKQGEERLRFKGFMRAYAIHMQKETK